MREILSNPEPQARTVSPQNILIQDIKKKIEINYITNGICKNSDFYSLWENSVTILFLCPIK